MNRFDFITLIQIVKTTPPGEHHARTYSRPGGGGLFMLCKVNWFDYSTYEEHKQ